LHNKLVVFRLYICCLPWYHLRRVNMSCLIIERSIQDILSYLEARRLFIHYKIHRRKRFNSHTVNSDAAMTLFGNMSHWTRIVRLIDCYICMEYAHEYNHVQILRINYIATCMQGNPETGNPKCNVVAILAGVINIFTW
jgi:hypothetical protein